MLEWIIRGGPVMIPILLCSVLALAVILEKFMYLRKIRLDTNKFMTEVSDSLKRNRAMDAINICEQAPGPLPNVLKAGILKYDRTRQEIKEAVEDAALREIPRMEKNISALAAIAHISTLLGLLGTVIGMIEVFRKIQEKAAALSPVTLAYLSSGIWQALIATAAGLIVAIPAITAYNYFVSRVNDFILQMEISATDLVNILSEKKVE
jgi:biopolymer transport protein ExbB